MIELLYYLIFFILGSVFGSFYNVLGLRLPNNESVVFPSSHCPKCNHELKWYELIPILSFIFLKGRCKECKEKISLLYPLNELFCGILFVVSYYSYGFSLELIIALTLSSLLVLVIASDLTYMIIPDSFTIVSSLIIIVVRLLSAGVMDTLASIGYGILSFGIMYLIMKLGTWLFKKDCMGGADIKLMFVVGLVLDPLLAMLVIVIASVLALPGALYAYFKNKEHMIPFGPFLVLGLLILYFTKFNMYDLLTLIN